LAARRPGVVSARAGSAADGPRCSRAVRPDNIPIRPAIWCLLKSLSPRIVTPLSWDRVPRSRAGALSALRYRAGRWSRERVLPRPGGPYGSAASALYVQEPGRHWLISIALPSPPARRGWRLELGPGRDGAANRGWRRGVGAAALRWGDASAASACSRSFYGRLVGGCPGFVTCSGWPRHGPSGVYGDGFRAGEGRPRCGPGAVSLAAYRLVAGGGGKRGHARRRQPGDVEWARRQCRCWSTRSSTMPGPAGLYKAMPFPAAVPPAGPGQLPRRAAGGSGLPPCGNGLAGLSAVS